MLLEKQRVVVERGMVILKRNIASTGICDESCEMCIVLFIFSAVFLIIYGQIRER